MIIAFVISAFFLQETRGSIILSRRAARLRQETGNLGYRCKADEEMASFKVLMKTSLIRPLHFLVTEPIVSVFKFLLAWSILDKIYSTFLCIYVAFAWGNLWGKVTRPSEEKV